MDNIKIYIAQYEFIKEEIRSSFIIHLEYNQISSTYNLCIPSNPLLDIEILKLFKKDFKKIMNKLDNIINEKTYSKTTIEDINKFKQWILLKINSGNNLNL